MFICFYELRSWAAMKIKHFIVLGSSSFLCKRFKYKFFIVWVCNFIGKMLFSQKKLNFSGTTVPTFIGFLKNNLDRFIYLGWRKRKNIDFKMLCGLLTVSVKSFGFTKKNVIAFYMKRTKMIYSFERLKL